jgi:hypothetical protein
MQSSGAARDSGSNDVSPAGGSGFRIHLTKRRPDWKRETHWALILIIILSVATVAAAISSRLDLISETSAKSSP